MPKTCSPSTTSAESKLPRLGLLELAAAVTLLALAVAFSFQSVVLNPSDVLVGIHHRGNNDLTGWFIRSHEFPVRSRSDGEKRPTWNPYLGMGQPYLGNPQSGICYPPNWLCSLCDVPGCLSWLLVGHHLWAGLGSVVLARYWGLRWSSGALCGIGLALAPYLVAQTAEGHYAQIAAVSWIPWTFVAYERFRQSAGLTWIAVSACLALSFFAGHAQETYYLALLLSLIVAVESTILLLRREYHRAGRLILTWVLVGIVTLGMVAVDLVPIWSSSRASARSGGLDLASAGIGLTLSHIRQLLNPFALGSPESAHQYWETIFHFGVVLGVFAGLGVILGGQRSGVRILAGLLVVATLFAFGNLTPVFAACHQLIPGVASFRMPSRMLFFCSFFVAMLAGFAVDSITQRIGNTRPGSGWHAFRRTCAVWLAPLIGIIVAGELGLHSHRVLATAPRSSLREGSPVSQFLSEHSGNFRVLCDQIVYGDREALIDRVQVIRAYEPVPLLRYAGLLDAMTSVPINKIDFTGFQPLNLSDFRKSVLDLAGVRYVVTVKKQPEQPGFKLIQHGRIPPVIAHRGINDASIPYWIYENESPLPRAFVLGKAQISPDWADTVRQVEELIPRNSVVVSQDMLPAGLRSGFREASIVEYSPNRVVLEAECDASGYVVLTDLYHPGWRAQINGRSAPVIPVDLSFRGIPVGAGRQRIVMQYHPPGLQFGMIVTGATIAVLAMVIGFSQARSDRLEQDRISPESPPQSESESLSTAREMLVGTR